MSVPGRCISVAAGNAGQEVAEFEGDLGYVMGRIHTSGSVPARGLAKDIEWVVVGNSKADISENELEIWYSPQDRFTVLVRPPGSSRWIGPVEPQQFIENQLLEEGCILSVYNELYHPSNGANYISLYLTPFLSEAGIVGIPAGNWTVRLHGLEVRDGKYHGWIERDDPRERGRIGDRETWSFPSFFSEASNVDNSSVSSLACGHRVLSVANLDDARRAHPHHQQPGADARQPLQAGHGRARHQRHRRQGLRRAGRPLDKDDGDEHGEPLRHRRGRADAGDGEEAAAHRRADRGHHAFAPRSPCPATASSGATAPDSVASTRMLASTRPQHINDRKDITK